MRLYSYVMTDDTGFAPNTDHGFLTLACCKPGIRKGAERGNWVLGVCGKGLANKKLCPGPYHIVFLAEVYNVVTFEEYWNNDQYKKKNPNPCFPNGDNLYGKRGRHTPVKRLAHSIHHQKAEEQKRDLNGINVLIAKRFCYFGNKGPCAANWKSMFPYNEDGAPIRPYRVITDGPLINRFVNWVQCSYRKKGVPHAGLIQGISCSKSY